MNQSLSDVNMKILYLLHLKGIKDCREDVLCGPTGSIFGKLRVQFHFSAICSTKYLIVGFLKRPYLLVD